MENDGRRKFLGVCLAGATVAAAAATAYPVFQYLVPTPGAGEAEKQVFEEGDLVAGEAKFFQHAGSAAVLVKTKNGETFALSAVCTHLGCIVQWVKEKQQFLCPCHGGQFAPDGRVLGGPPPRPLARIPFTVAERKITVG